MTKKVTVPAGPVGVVFGGSPPEIKTIKETSALAGLAREGEYIVGLIVPGVVEQTGGFDEKSLVAMLKQYSDAKERIIVIEKDSSSFPDRKISKVHAKGGKIGVVFGGSPPVITDVREDSPLADRVSIGQVVTGLSIPGRVDLEGRLDTHELVSALKANEDEDDRILTLLRSLTDLTDQLSETQEGDSDEAIPPSKYAKPGGTWYIQEFGGRKTMTYGCLGFLCLALPGLIICCLSLDKRYVYQEPNNGKRFDVMGNQLEKNGKPLHALPKGTKDPMKMAEHERMRPL